MATNETNSQNLTAQEMGALAEKQMKDRVVQDAANNPGQIVTGGQVGTVGVGTLATPQTFQTAYNTESIANRAPGVKDAAKTGVITSKPADNYVKDFEKKAQTQEEKLREMANQAASRVFTYQPNDKDREAMEYANKYGASVGFLPETTTGINKIREQIEPQEQRMQERQTEEMATRKAAEYYSGRSGTDYRESALDKIKVEHDRQTKEFNTQARDLLNAAWSAALGGNVDVAEKLNKQADEVKKQAEISRKQAQEEIKGALEIEKLATERVDTTTDRMVQQGYQPTEKQLEYLDTKYGLDKGTSATLYETSRIDFRRSEAKTRNEEFNAAVDGASKLQGLLEKVPIGTSVTIGGVEYTGLSRGAIKTGTETDDNGNVTFWEYDQDSGATRTTSLGNIGKESDGWNTQFDDNGNAWRFNAKTGQMVPYGATVTQQEWQGIFPEGSTSPFVDAQGNPRVQCGAFVNDCTGAGVGDTFESKMAKTDPTIKPDSENPPRTGDFFVQKLGTWTGHVGIIADEKTDPRTGEKLYLALESNYPQPEKITNSRWIKAKDIDGFGRTGKLHPVLQTGPDARGAGLTGAGTIGAGVTGGAPSPTGRPTFGAKKAEVEKPQRFEVGGRIIEVSSQGTKEIYVSPTAQETEKPLSVDEVMKINETLPADQRIPLGTKLSQVSTDIRPSFGNKKTTEAPLSADEIKKYGLDPKDPANVGLTLSGIKDRLSQIDADSFEEFAQVYRYDNPRIEQRGDSGVTVYPTDAEVRRAWEEKKRSTPSQTEASKIADAVFNGSRRYDEVDKIEDAVLKDQVYNELVKRREGLLSSGDRVSQFKATIGGKPLDQSDRVNINKGFLVLGQLDTLKQAMGVNNDKKITATIDGKKVTGDFNASKAFNDLSQYIAGATRQNIPVDEQAVQVNAILKGLLPNLARGIYGEVGVLTNADIENYKQTLPNLRTPESQRQALLGLTTRVVQRSIEGQLETAASSGLDVSGFIPQYKKLARDSDRLLYGETTVTDPSGKVRKFNSKAEADKFRSDVNL